MPGISEVQLIKHHKSLALSCSQTDMLILICRIDLQVFVRGICERQMSVGRITPARAQ